MKVGIIGCGKLGLPVALAIESRGHEVRGYDINPKIIGYLMGSPYPHKEEGIEALLAKTKMQMVQLDALCSWADILFMAPQTPHDERFEGHMPLPEERADFDYQYLRACVLSVNDFLPSPKPCVIISTVLPGTIEREVMPLIDKRFALVYSPQFIAMGTVVHNFLNPEFWLVGCDTNWATNEAIRLFSSIALKPVVRTNIRTAEGIKVFYNTFITAKTVLANLYGEMAERLGMNVDDIFRAISLSTDRLLSTKYLQAGMGDGGGCHPRDNIALSWLAREKGMSFDFFSALMEARERHCDWLAELIEKNRGELPVALLGRAFKPETNIETGSPAVLLSRILRNRGVAHSSQEDMVPTLPGLYFIATKHERFRNLKFPEGSVVIDPFRYIPEQDGVRLVSIGSGQKLNQTAEALCK